MGSLQSIKPTPIPTQDPIQSNPATSSTTTMITTTLLITTMISTSFALFFFSSTPTRHHTATIIHHAPPLTKLKHPTIILISSDGFRFGYQYKTPTPNIDRLIKYGTEAKTGLIPVFPTLTFPNHYSIVTGLYPSYHGIINNEFYDPESGHAFKMSSHDPHFWLGEPLWETITKHGLLAATYFWPGSEVKKGAWDCDIKYCKPYNESVPFEERVDTVLSYFDTEQKDEGVPVFMTLYFEDPDHEGHQVGPDDVEVTNAVSRIDGLIGRLISGLEKRGVFEDVTVIIVGDHGMVSTCDQKVIYLDDLVPWVNVAKEWVQDYSPVLSIRPPLGVSVKNVVAKMNEGLSSGKVKNGDKLKVYLKEDLPDRLHYWESDRIPPIIGLVAEGYTIDQEDKNVKQCGGAHGYDNAFFSMRTIFIGHGPQFAKGRKVPSFENVQIYNIVTLILNISGAANNGSLSFAKSVLLPHH